MRNLLALVGAAVVTFAIVGWYRGWYQVRTEADGTGHREVNININGPKIKQDLHSGREKLENALENKGPAAPAPAAARAPQAPGGPPAATPPTIVTPVPAGEEYVLPSGNAVPPAPGTRFNRN